MSEHIISPEHRPVFLVDQDAGARGAGRAQAAAQRALDEQSDPQVSPYRMPLADVNTLVMANARLQRRAVEAEEREQSARAELETVVAGAAKLEVEAQTLFDMLAQANELVYHIAAQASRETGRTVS